MERRSVGFRVMCCDVLRLSNHRDGRSEQVLGSRVARAERWRSVATASAVVERREASAPPPNPPPQAGEGKEKRVRATSQDAVVTEQRLSAFRFPFFFFVARIERSEIRGSLSRGNVFPDFACAQSGLRPYPHVILMAAGPTPGTV